MKIDLKRIGRTAWTIVTEVPGWPDAPRHVRLQRALPVLLPCVGMSVILGWVLLVQAPRARQCTEALQPLVVLENEISQLQLACSEQEVHDVADRATAVGRMLLGSLDELSPYLKSLKKEAADRGWDIAFTTADTSVEPSSPEAVIGFLTVRAKAVPIAGNAEPFTSFLSVLERFSSAGKRIDLMRAAVRADDQHWHSVELALRLAVPMSHEKTP